MSLPPRFADLTAIRDMFNSLYATIGGNNVSSILTITFDASLEGETWTVTDGANETYTGTVGSSLTADVRLTQLNTTYTVTVTNGTGGTVEIGLYYEHAELSAQGTGGE